MSNYFFRFEDISDSESVLGNVERTAAIVKRNYICHGVITDVTVFHVNFYFEDWKSLEILAADRFEAGERYEQNNNQFWKDFTLKPLGDTVTEEDIEAVLFRLIEYANGRLEEWINETFHESHPLFVEIDM